MANPATTAGKRSARTPDGVPRLFVYGALLLVCLAFVPPAIIARVRASPSPKRQIALIQNMYNQPRFNPQASNPIFEDGRAMRLPTGGTVAREDPATISTRTQGGSDGVWSATLPPEVPLDLALLRRGQERFAIYCALCHGYAGFGDGIVNARAMELMSNVNGPVNGTAWVQAKSLHDPAVVEQPVGQIFHTITYGIRQMAGYGAQIPVEDRWAIAAYVKALQRSQNASESDIPADKRNLMKPPA